MRGKFLCVTNEKRRLEGIEAAVVSCFVEGKFWGEYISSSYLFSNIKHKTFIYIFLGAPSGLRSDNFKLSLLFLLSLFYVSSANRTNFFPFFLKSFNYLHYGEFISTTEEQLNASFANWREFWFFFFLLSLFFLFYFGKILKAVVEKDGKNREEEESFDGYFELSWCSVRSLI